MKIKKLDREFRYEELKAKYQNKYLGMVNELALKSAKARGQQVIHKSLNSGLDPGDYIGGSIDDTINNFTQLKESFPDEGVYLNFDDSDEEYSSFDVMINYKETKKQFDERIQELTELLEYKELKEEFLELENYKRLKEKYG